MRLFSRTATLLFSLQSLNNLPSLVFAEEEEKADKGSDSEDATDDIDDEEGSGSEGSDGEGADTGKGDVFQLDKENFEGTMKNNKFVLIKWYAPWCGHCRSMKEDYKKLATAMKGLKPEDFGLSKDLSEGDKPLIAEVDATQEEELAASNDVQGYPTLTLFSAGAKKATYSGGRSEAELMEFLKKSVGPTLKTVTQSELDELKKARKFGDAVLVVEGKKDDTKLKDAATKIADLPLIASTTVFLESESASKLTIYKGTKEVEVYTDNSGDFSKDLEASKKWVTEQRRPMFGQINESNFEIYMEAAKNGLFWVCFDPASIGESLEKYSGFMVEAAKKMMKSKGYPFVWLDITEFEEHARDELSCKDYPTIVLQRGDLLSEEEDAKVDKFVRSFAKNPSDLTLTAVDGFFADIEAGKLEPVPEPDELEAMDDSEEDEDKKEDL